MTNRFWDLEEPRGRILPALAAGLVPVIVALLAATLMLGLPALRAQERGQEVFATATELRSTSRALQRDVLLLIFDERTREATAARIDTRIPEFRRLAARLEEGLAPMNEQKARQLRVAHENLANGVAAVLAAARAGEPASRLWYLQQTQVLANEVPAARANDPVIDEFRVHTAGALAEVRQVYWLLLAVAAVSLGFGVASAAVVLRR